MQPGLEDRISLTFCYSSTTKGQHTIKQYVVIFRCTSVVVGRVSVDEDSGKVFVKVISSGTVSH